MLVSFISPVKFLRRIDKKGDISFALGHIALESEEYRTWFANISTTRLTMLDNGAFELGGSIPADKLIELCREMLPHEVYGPDYPGDPLRTLLETTQFAKKVKKLKLCTALGDQIRVVGCVQGDTLSEWLSCYRQMSECEDIDTLAVPICTLSDFATDEEPRLRQGMTRIRLVRSLHDLGVIKKPLHLTGLDHPQELREYKDIPLVRSMDSTSAVVHGMAGVRFEKDNWAGKIKKKLDFNLDVITEGQFADIQHNIEMIRRFAHGI